MAKLLGFRKIVFLLAFFCLSCVSLAFTVEVFEAHPRLFFRDSAWGERSITTGQLRQRASDPRYAAYVNRLTYSACNVALKAVLFNDSQAARECISMMESDFGFGETTTDGELVMWRAMAFDWLYNHPEFTEDHRQNVIEKLVQGANWCRGQYISQGPHVFHTRMYAFALGAAMAGLALKGHHDDADLYLEWADSIFTHRLFPARQLQAGSVHNSLAYGRRYTMWHTGHFMSAWYSATGEDKWKAVRQQQEDWAWREAEFIMYGRQPDGLLVRYGDCYRRTSERFSFRVIGERAFAYSEPAGMNYLHYLFSTQADMPDNRVVEEGNAYNVLLWWDADDPGRTFSTLPGRTVFSPDGTGMVFWRTGWGEHDTFIFFKCGNYFGNHGHFDQGHLKVFRRAPLLIEGGAYEGSFDSDYRLNYYRKTISHNSILAVNPALSADEGGQRIVNNQSEESVESYLGNPINETGDIIDYQDNGNWCYVSGSFGSAYDNTRITMAVREAAWIGDRYLVVVDNIKLAAGSFLPKVIWHYTVWPRIEANRFTVADSGARAVVTVLAPAQASIDTVQAYRIGTAYYPPPDPRPSIGVGRVEISAPQTGATEYTFVQVIDVADEGITPAEMSFETDQAEGTISVTLPVGVLRLGGSPLDRTEVVFEAASLEPGGDFSGNGSVGIEDLVSLILRSLTNPNDPLLDFDRDGRYSIMDAVSLLIHIRAQAAGLSLAAARMAEFPLGPAERKIILDKLKMLDLTESERYAVHSLLGLTRLPESFALAQNHPNPFNPSTTIGYTVADGAALRVRLAVYNLRGAPVKVLVDGLKEPGYFYAHWDGTDARGAAVPSGVYFYRLSAGKYSEIKKMILLR